MKRRSFVSTLAVAGSLLFPSLATAQITPDADEVSEEDGAIVVTGLRGVDRTVAESPVPIDVFSSDDLEAVSYTDTNDVLKTLVPSYTLSRQPISDGSSFIRPATLRGMPTDKTLVLVNSKRRHRAALVTIGGSGTQGPDIATIPTIALKSVQVLRDGAAAQYGSDAIAGVINFLLKDASDGISLEAEAGQFYEGDGFEYRFAGNIGLPLGDNGFVNLSAEYYDADSTNRAEQYCEPWFCVDEYAAQPGNEEFAAAVEGIDTVQPWGRPSLEAVRTFVNAGYTLSDAVELYGFGSYSWSTGTGNFFYRYPGNGTIEPIRREDGSVWTPLEFFPGGFTPSFTGEISDYSMVGGVRGDLSDMLSYDLSARYGRNEISYTLSNTINPSLGPDSPTSFKPGDLINDEFQLQADFVMPFDVGLAGDLNFGFGATYFEEGYELVEGEPLSYAAGPYSSADPWGFCTDDGMATPSGAAIPGLDCSDGDDPVYTVVGVGSNGFPGYSPDFSGTYDRHSYALYGDLSADVTENLFLQGALRYEDYSDFGTELIYKVAGRYEFIDGFAVRGSYGTGFRAPTPGQQGTTNVSTRLPNGFPVATGLFPAGSAVAQALGATPLRPEKSTNYTLGLTGDLGSFTYSIDYYRIELQDRLNAISTISVVDDCDTATDGIQDDCLGFRGNLIDAGVVGAESIGGVFYFTNAFDTVTQGVDIVGSYTTMWSAGRTSVTAAVNYNKSKFDGPVDGLFNDEDQYDFVNFDPKWRGVFTVSHDAGPVGLVVRANYFGKSTNSDGNNAPLVYQTYGSEIMFDVEGSYSLTDLITLSVGARNIFDNYPDKADFEYCCGRVYNSGSTVDWMGGYYYARIRARF
ncbi:TonB-dependent receptor plug domain-containing protein [Croceicoccus marinus]|uniref:TonB-dependent receptor n=1 Tax=Croceicoccus marinus TaxID=450378 RepID=A0A7G6VW41_9SPHN|nr:TonB-dependent receptor [Croceicoccus marinus]QNE05956.1 TonB-dependent receptor [Croceicoccus marinus]